MKINANRLGRLLGEHGFVRSFPSSLDQDYVFYRPDYSPELFQGILISASGKHQEAVCVRACVGAISQFWTKGLVELSVILELAADKERGWTIINDHDSAVAWENRVAETAPEIVSAFCAEHRTQLLEDTQVARQATERYLEFLRVDQPMEEVLDGLKRTAESIQLTKADRLLHSAGVVHHESILTEYRIACLAITLYASQIETIDPDLLESNPLSNRELMWRIQLIADRLVRSQDRSPE